MAISMKKKRSGKETLITVLVIVLAIALAVGAVVLLPISYELKKLLFFLLIVVFAVLGVIIMNKLKRR